MNEQPPVVEAVHVSKRFGPTTALHEVGMAVRPGSTHALVGRNGAGKSTLVAILTGLQAPDSGRVTFSGRPAPSLSDRDGWRREVACVYQKSTIIPTLTVAENLFLNRQAVSRFGLIGWPALRREALGLLASWSVDVDVAQPASALNVEQRQLVEIARALSFGARFIILDEPTAQLDGAAIRRLFTRIRTLPEGLTELRRVLARIGVAPDWLAETEQVWSSPYDGPRRRAVIPIFWWSSAASTPSASASAARSSPRMRAGSPTSFI